MARNSLLQNRLLHPRHWMSWFALWVLWLVAKLPLPVLSLLGTVVGELSYRLMSSRRHIARRNIEACFPELGTTEHRRLVHRHFWAAGQALMGTTVAWFASANRLERLCRIRGREHLDQARAQKQRVILLVAHFVSVQIGGTYLSIDTPVVDIYRTLRNPVFDRAGKLGCERFKGTMVEMREGIGAAIKEAKKGALLHYIPDQDAGTKNAAFIPFFGVQTSTITMLGRLAKITDAVVIPCFTRQLSWGRGYEVIFKPAFEHFPTDDPVANARRMNEEIENAVREMPEQYFWVHKRFKTRPPGEPDFYA
ncbi:MAG: lipid A biosynthesis acyltransferase [Acidiferrobacterales bacterium]